MVVKKYVLATCKQMADLQGKVFEIDGLSVTFSLEELPNDMKMLAMLGRGVYSSIIPPAWGGERNQKSLGLGKKIKEEWRRKGKERKGRGGISSFILKFLQL